MESLAPLLGPETVIPPGPGPGWVRMTRQDGLQAPSAEGWWPGACSRMTRTRGDTASHWTPFVPGVLGPAGSVTHNLMGWPEGPGQVACGTHFVFPVPVRMKCRFPSTLASLSQLYPEWKKCLWIEVQGATLEPVFSLLAQNRNGGCPGLGRGPRETPPRRQ